MCISIHPTVFSKTVTGIYEAETGEHVQFYGNVVGRERSSSSRRPLLLGGDPDDQLRGSTRTGSGRRSSFGGHPLSDAVRKRPLPSNWQDDEPDSPSGNALLMPIFGEWDSINLLDTSNTPDLLRDIRSALQGPVSRGGLLGSRSIKSADSVRVIQFDVYTIVLAQNATLIPDAVKKLANSVQPAVNQRLFDTLGQWYKDVPMAICCFAEKDAQEAKPIAFRYEPFYPDTFLIYMLDAHDGHPPKLDETVDVDHAIFAGSYRMGDKGTSVRYSDTIDEALRPYVPSRVVGRQLPAGTRMINGDVLVKVDDVVKGDFNAYRVVPPNAPKRARVKI